MTNTWMTRLAAHYNKMRSKYPEDKLLILFDIDGTILDMRYLVQHVLNQYDDVHGTRFFRHLRLDEITVHENQIEFLLRYLNIDPAEHDKIKTWFEREAWSPPAILHAHCPFAGVLEVIRWFQLQPLTEVGLNTGRLETVRADTLRSLNQLGVEYKVRFVDPLLYMNPNTWDEPVTKAKVSGIRYFQEMGYRIVAFIDNEPANLQAVAQADPHREILLLHADTIFQSRHEHLPPHAVGGSQYHLSELVSEQLLPRHIHFVWHNLNNNTNLVQFLASDVYWGEFTIQTASVPDSKSDHEAALNLNWSGLELLLLRLSHRNKGIKFNFQKNSCLTHRVMELVAEYNLSGVWFNVDVASMPERDFRQLAALSPGAVIQVSVDFLAPMISQNDPEALEILKMYHSWGINRFGLNWYTPNVRRVAGQLETWGFEQDIYNVRDLETFLQAILVMPSSITSTFNFPQWSYYGSDSSLEQFPVMAVSNM
jgi:hypothetical protein